MRVDRCDHVTDRGVWPQTLLWLSSTRGQGSRGLQGWGSGGICFWNKAAVACRELDGAHALRSRRSHGRQEVQTSPLCRRENQPPLAGPWRVHLSRLASGLRGLPSPVRKAGAPARTVSKQVLLNRTRHEDAVAFHGLNIQTKSPIISTLRVSGN